MHAGRGLTPEDIAAAAEKLVARGEKPSARAVRAELGAGSMATITPALAAWRASRPRVEGSGSHISPELQRAMLAEIERAVTSARSELAAELADTQDANSALAEELKTQTAAAIAAEKQAADAKTESERQAGTIASLERSLAEAREQIAQEHETAEHARREAAEAAVRLETLPGLHAEIEALRKRFDEEREARLRAEIAAAELRGTRTTKKGL
jgi:colicin import membrane protein